jgi:septal ring factor EnvC (AmiA/AmiB activator)
MNDTVRDIALWVTPGLVMVVFALLQRSVSQVDKHLEQLKADTRDALAKIAQHDTRHAVTESRLSQQDARMSKMEGDIAMLHGRVSRLISAKIDSLTGESKEE